MEAGIALPGLHFSYELVNIRAMSADELLASPNRDDRIWALVAQGDPALTMPKILATIAELPDQDRPNALARLTALSGMLKLDGALRHFLEEFPMLTVDLKNNAVLRPLIEEERREARVEGRIEARRDNLAFLLTKRFGRLPKPVLSRIEASTEPQLEHWFDRLLDAQTLDELFA